jgi:septin family protein
MKTAYELAMERLNRSAPAVRLTEEQKGAIAELESKCRARTAEREIFLNGEMDKARAAGDGDALAQLERQLASERRKFQEELEEKKEQVRRGRQ